MTSTKVDILVSGAGPVGLFFAYQMALRGHSVYCVDPKPSPTTQSRAILITSRTLETLERRGLASDILSESYIASGVQIFRHGSKIGHIDACGDTNFQHFTILMQGKTEDVIYKRLEEETDCRIHWNTELVSYVLDDAGVTSIVRDNKTKEEKTIESKYIVGADGSHSCVRKSNPEWTYDGVALPTKFFLADLTMQGDHVKELLGKMNIFVKGSKTMGMVRINPFRQADQDDEGDDAYVFRVFGNVESYTNNATEQNGDGQEPHEISSEDLPNLEYAQGWIDELAAPLKFQADKLIWSSFFKINERIANGFRKGRAFLIGDSAHCHSPAGGQGMNLGLQDADNLAWKMSDVLKGIAADPEKLLESYNKEREPMAKSTIQFTGNVTRTVLMANNFVSNIRLTLVSVGLMLPQIRQYLFKFIMQQFVTIDSKSNILGTSDKGLIKAGDYLPDTGFLRKSIVPRSMKKIERLSLGEVLIGCNQYTVIFVGTCFSGTSPNLDMVERFWKNTTIYPIRRLVIESAWHCQSISQFPKFVGEAERMIAEESFYSEERMDLSISVTNRVGLYAFLPNSGKPPSAVVIVRPDSYIAHAKIVTSIAELDEALKFLSFALTQQST